MDAAEAGAVWGAGKTCVGERNRDNRGQKTLNGEMTMKKNGWMAVCAAMAIGVAATGARAEALITEGSSELGVGGELDFVSPAGTVAALNLRYGYFFWDGISIGGLFGLYDDDDVTRYEIGAVGEYNFRLGENYRPLVGTDFVPFVGVSARYAYADLSDNKSALVFGAEGGTKFFLTDSAAVTFSLAGDLATEKVYPDDKKMQNWDVSLQLGMRFYF